METHEYTFEAGPEESRVWKCETCGRWIVFSQNHRMTIINKGDEYVAHFGTTGPDLKVMVNGIQP